MIESPSNEKVNPNKRQSIKENAKISDSINPSKNWDINPLVNILSIDIINKIKAIPISRSDITNRINWKFT